MKQEKTSSFKRYFLYLLIAGLSITALISIIAVIIGEWNDAITRSIGLTVSGWIHSMFALSIMNSLDRSDKKHSLVIYSVFGATLASFIITVLNIFNIFPTGYAFQLTIRLYTWLLGAIFSCFVIDALRKLAKNKDIATKSSLYVTIGSVATFITICLLFVFDEISYDLPAVIGRILLAVAILGSTSSIISVVLTRLHKVKHPKLYKQTTKSDSPQNDQERARGLPVWAIILITISALFTVGPLIFTLLGFFLFAAF